VLAHKTKRVANEKNVNNRIGNPEWADYYEFEHEVLAVNKMKEVNEYVG